MLKNKLFSASYNAHKKTHKDFKCAICNENFNQKIKYMSHMGMHETVSYIERTSYNNDI